MTQSAFPSLAVVVPHTHWDREWYRTRHEFQLLLVEVIDRVVDLLESEPAFTFFLLDGQTIVLEDYLDIRPENEARLRGHITAGRLGVGPWYVLSDEFLVGPESHVRNLLLGRQVARRFGEPLSVGYIPDAFGHIAQMPQILRRAGIDGAIFTRGMDDEIDRVGWEHRWVAPDGSEVLALNQCDGYCAAGALGFQSDAAVWDEEEIDLRSAVAQVTRLFERMRQHANGGIVQVSNGCDHLPPQRNLAGILQALRQAMPDTEFRVGNLSDLLSAIRDSGTATEVRVGELLGSRHQFILSGVWSSRVNLKQLNERCETFLSRVAEPLACYEHFVHGRDYPERELTQLWKLLLQNHPHDSICGCSIDEVHREMVTRFDGVLAGSARLARRLMPTTNSTARVAQLGTIVVFNPLPTPRTAVVRRLVALPATADPSRVCLVDAGGQPIPFVVQASHLVRHFWSDDFASSVDGAATLEMLERYREGMPERFDSQSDHGARAARWLSIEFEAALPAVGSAGFRLVADADPTGGGSGVRATGNTVENDWVRATLHGDGRVDIRDKRTGIEFAGLNQLESTEDAGDEYDHAPAPTTRTVTSRGSQGSVRLASSTPLRVTLEATYAWDLPSGLTGDRRNRVEHVEPCPVRVRLSLERTSPTVHLDVTIVNRAKDHRIRSRFPTPIAAGEIHSDGHFYVNRRPVEIDAKPEWLQPPTGTYPQQEFSAVQGEAGGLAVFSRGLHEIAPIRQDDGTAGFAVTLLRGVGWLSRDDLPTRDCQPVGPLIPTPEAQCMGRYTFQFGILPFSGPIATSNVRQESAAFRVPPLSVHATGEAVTQSEKGLIHVTGSGVGITSIKKHHARDTLIVRVFNDADQATVARFASTRPIVSAWQCSLLEDRLHAVVVDESGCLIDHQLAPSEIATLEMAF